MMMWSMMGSQSQTWLMRLSRSSSQRRDRLTPPVFLGFPDCSDDKESAHNVGDLGSIPGLGRSPGEGNGYLLQNSCLENSTDWGTWQATVHGVTKGQTQLNDFHFQEIDYLRRHNNELYLTIFQGIFQGRERNLPLKLWWKWGGGHFSAMEDLVCLYSHVGVCFIFVKLDIYKECTSVYFMM